MTVTGQAAAWIGAPPPAFVVNRPALVDRLEAATQKRVVRIVAPAGYGKSVLLAQWQRAHPERRTAWVAARSTDDATRFGRRLAEAIELIVPAMAQGALAHLRRDGAALGEDFLAIVLAELSYAAPVTVVVEDLEVLASPVVLDELGLLAERAADGVGFVFVSRDDRLPKTLRLRLRDEVAEIRQDTLALSWEEAGEAIQRVAGQTLHPAQVQALHSRTEGWAAGIQLAALSLRDHDDPDRFVEQFAGDDRHVADYLSGEVLALQSPEVRDFLVRVAVLDRLSGPLCDAVTGGTDGQRTLERLDQQSLFIRPLDGRRQWYGYHPLFRDLLRFELRATRPGVEEDLLHRAAAWHLEQGEADDAAEYLLRANDWAAVIALARAEGGRYFERGEATSVLRWLGEVPSDVLLADPDAALVKVTLHTMCGSSMAAQELLDRLESSVTLDAGQQALAATNRAGWVYYHLPPAAAHAAAETALGLLDGDTDLSDTVLLDVLTPAALRSVATVSQAVACWSEADHAGARARLATVIDEPGPVVWLVHALGELAWVAVATGHLRLGLATARRALDVAEEAGLGHHTGTAMAHLALARAHRMRGEDVAGHLDTGLAQARLNQRTRVLSLEWAERADLALGEGRTGDGLGQIASAQVAAGPPLASVVEAELAALEVRLHLLAGSPSSARAAVERQHGLHTSSVAAAAAALAVATDDWPALRKLVDDWDVVDRDEPVARWSRGLAAAVLADREGDRRTALALVAEVVADAEVEGAVRPFVDGGPAVLRLVRAHYHAEPTPFLRRLVEDVPPVSTRGSAEMVEQLTERELLVLRYLPSRLSNADIAARLYVSINTLKTHIKNIYRKLEVGDRGEAIARAEELGLL
ncbi:MAG TPA: LuxR C-terminal-related transcriptional regulator [Acidimicrobiales bacterium]